MIETGSIFISIIMPTFNRAELIEESVNSILSQTHRNFELIIIDDGSTDNTENRIKNIADDRIRYLSVEPIHDLVKLRMKGIEKASADMIAFADSDDLWASNKLERQLAVFNTFPDCDLVLTGGYNFVESNVPAEFFYKTETIRFGYLLEDIFTSKVTAILPSVQMKRKCIEKITLTPSTDIDLLIELLHERKAAILPENLYFRRKHNTNMHSSSTEVSYADMQRTIRNCKENEYINHRLAHQALYELHLRFGDKYKHSGQKNNARKCYASAWSMQPYRLTGLKRFLTV